MAPANERSQRPTRTRHVVLWLTVLAYLIVYLDRVVIAAAAPQIQQEFGFSLVTMGFVFSAFQIGYSLFQIPGGWLSDKFGPRKVLTGMVVWWSAFTAMTTLAWSASSMIAIRFLFGVGEAGAFPTATRSLSRWMLPSERGYAQGLTHAGARLGGALTPAFAVFLIAQYGWRTPFLLFAVIGVAWGILWYWYYRDSPTEHRGVNAAELAVIGPAAYGPKGANVAVPWRQILRSPQMWLLSAAYACYAYDFGTFITWFPKYLNDARGFSLTEIGIFASAPLAAGVLGDIIGGWVSDRMAEKSGDFKMARRLIFCPGMIAGSVLIYFAAITDSPYAAVGLFSAALFCLELTVGVSWAVTLDIGHEYAGSVSSVMNTAGNLAIAVSATATGFIVTHYDWQTNFLIQAALALLGGIIFLWVDASKRIYN